MLKHFVSDFQIPGEDMTSSSSGDGQDFRKKMKKERLKPIKLNSNLNLESEK